MMTSVDPQGSILTNFYVFNLPPIANITTIETSTCIKLQDHLNLIETWLKERNKWKEIKSCHHVAKTLNI